MRDVGHISKIRYILFTTNPTPKKKRCILVSTPAWSRYTPNPTPIKGGKRRRRKTPLHIHKGTPPFHSFLNWHPSKFDTSLTYINHCFKTSLSTLFVLLLLRPKIHIIQNLVRMISVVSLMYTKTVRPSPPLDLWWPEEGPTVIPLSAHLRAYQEAISVFV